MKILLILGSGSITSQRKIASQNPTTRRFLLCFPVFCRLLLLGYPGGEEGHLIRRKGGGEHLLISTVRLSVLLLDEFWSEILHHVRLNCVMPIQSFTFIINPLQCIYALNESACLKGEVTYMIIRQQVVSKMFDLILLVKEQ